VVAVVVVVMVVITVVLVTVVVIIVGVNEPLNLSPEMISTLYSTQVLQHSCAN
jgi:hypothetical protein